MGRSEASWVYASAKTWPGGSGRTDTGKNSDMARPRKINETLRDRVVGTRFTTAELALVEAVAGGHPLGTVVRTLALAAASGAKVPTPQTSADGAKLRAELTRIGNNLNQSTRALHTIAARLPKNKKHLTETVKALAASTAEVRDLVAQEITRR